MSKRYLAQVYVILTYHVEVGLSQLTTAKIAAGMQVNESNPMVGLEGRASLLTNLGKAPKANPQFFGQDARPGNLIGE